ncbi:TPA: PTS sugar transporter subunit IIA, partial [Candidatus Poribacteria bacterium]|nr:PTS sugar transporter subunit IIA [Candidatus Poribacteria bacterium]
MKSLVELISPDRIVTLKSKTKEEALRELVEVISRSPRVRDKEELLKAILDREKIMSTGIGLGIAVPHAKLDSISDFVIAMGISKEGIEFNALDDKPVYIIVMIAGPNQQTMYLRTLAK